jgi:hypothetical protein
MSKLALETGVVPPGKSSSSDHSQVNLLSPDPASETAVSPLGTDATASGTTAPYRLYKRRWLGVIAMVCTVFFFTPNSTGLGC